MLIELLSNRREKKARAAEEKRKRLEDAEKKRAAMQAAMNKSNQQAPVERNFVITKRTDGGPGAALGNTGFDRVIIILIHIIDILYMYNTIAVLQFSNVMSARSEMGKTKEQLAEDKKIAPLIQSETTQYWRTRCGWAWRKRRHNSGILSFSWRAINTIWKRGQKRQDYDVQTANCSLF